MFEIQCHTTLSCDSYDDDDDDGDERNQTVLLFYLMELTTMFLYTGEIYLDKKFFIMILRVCI